MAYTHCCLNHNNGVFSFIEKTEVTSYEITKLSLTRVLKFHGLWSFQTAPLYHHASPRRYPALSLQSAPLEWYQAATPERDIDLTVNLKLQTRPTSLSGVLCPRSGVCKSNFISGTPSLSPRERLPTLLQPPRRPDRVSRSGVMTLHRTTNRQCNNFGVLLFSRANFNITNHDCKQALSSWLRLEGPTKQRGTSMHLHAHFAGVVHGQCRSFWTSHVGPEAFHLSFDDD